MKGIGNAAIAAMLAGLAGMGSAQAQVTIPQEYEKTVKAAGAIGALGDNLFGENISFYTGATSFSVVDVSLPGNNGLPVEIRRSFSIESRDAIWIDKLIQRDGSFGEWELDLPYLHGIFQFTKGWQAGGETGFVSNKRCSLAESYTVEPEAPIQGAWLPAEYWHGNSLHMPGGGEQELLVVGGNGGLPTIPNATPPGDGKTYVWVTNDRWYFSCLPNTANGVAGDAFLAVDPQGNRYYFNWFVSRLTTGVKRQGSTSSAATMNSSSMATVGTETAAQPSSQEDQVAAGPINTWITLEREEVRILPTRIEDRFGNYVTYTYDAANPRRLLSIVASDGRSLSMSYDAAGHISTVSDGTRTWTYVYGNGLTEVQLPDGRKWLIDFTSLRYAKTKPTTVTQTCNISEADAAQDVYVGTITHPSGAVGQFSFQSKTHGRSYVPKRCVNLNSAGTSSYANVPYLFNTVGIIQKQVSGPGISTPYVWTYSYGAPNNSWLENCGGGCTATKTVEVTGPGNEWTRYTFGNRYEYSEGKMLKVESGSSASAILSVDETIYQQDATGLPYPPRIGWSVYARGDHMAERLIPTSKRETTRQGRKFTWQVASDCGSGAAQCFDQYARPTKAIKTSTSSP